MVIYSELVQVQHPPDTPMPFYEPPGTTITDMRDAPKVTHLTAHLLERRNYTDVSDFAYADVRAISEELGKGQYSFSELVFFARNQLRLSCPNCDALNLLYSPERDHLGQGLPSPIECYYCDWKGSRTEVRAQQIANYITEIPGVGPATVDQLADAYGTVWRIVEADPNALAAQTRLSPEKAREVHTHLCETIHPELDPRDTEPDITSTLEAHRPKQRGMASLVDKVQCGTQLDEDDAEWFVKATVAFRDACPDPLRDRIRETTVEFDTVRKRIDALQEERRGMIRWTSEELENGEEIPVREFVGDRDRQNEINEELEDLQPQRKMLRETLSNELEAFFDEDEFRFETKKEAIVAARAIFDQELSTPIQGAKIARTLGCSKGYPSEFVLKEFESGSVVVPKEYVQKRTALSDVERREIIGRDDQSCVRCGDNRQLEVHHITPVSDDGTNDPENLATLCHSCHLDAHGGIMLSHDVIYDSRDEFWEWTA